ncbi:MAG: sodium:solute symporter family protein [bacterium]|jgi:SSS family transporter
MSIGLIILGLYLFIMVVIGVVAGRLQKSTTHFWVGNRGFGAPVLAVAILASIMHGGTIIGGTGAIAAQGATTLNNLSFALGFLVVLLFMAEKLRRFGGFTLPDFLGDRYESNSFRAFSAFVVLVSAVVSLIAQTKSMGLVVQQMSGLTPTVSLVLATAIFVFYTSIGGMLAAVWTDIAQWLFMTVGLGALLVVLWGQLGGLTGMALAAESAAPGWTSLTGVGWTQTGFWTWHLVWFIAYFTRIEFVTKMYTAKDEHTAKLSVAYGLILILIFFSVTVFYGGAARALVWDQLQTPDQAFPVLVQTYLPSFWGAFALAGVAAAAMSTVSSLLLLSGAAIAHDLLRKCYHEPNGIKKSDEYYLQVSRLTLLGVGVVALIGAFYTPTLVLTIVSYAVALTGAAFAMPMLLGLIWPRTSSEGAYYSSIGGFLGSAIWAVLTEMGFSWAKAVHPIFPGIIISTILIFAVTAMTEPVSEQTINQFFPGYIGTKEAS